VNEYSALAIVHAVNTTKRETVHVKKHLPSWVSGRYQRTEGTIDEAPRNFGKVDDVLRPVIVNTNAV